jgi:N,N'-diacetyllegionaminate synthase
MADELIRAGSRKIGAGQPCFLAAEIGINHNGEFRLAHELVMAAARAGADGVKFQNYRTEDFLTDRSLTYSYTSQGRPVTESQWDMFQRCEMRPDWLPGLKTLCDELGVVFFSTPSSEQGVRELVEVGAGLLKNGSDYLTHIPLLEHMGRTAIPVVLSTGMANAEDIDDALAAVERGGGSPIILLHCTSTYPAPDSQVNLRRMVSLEQRYGVPVGFSDHTAGALAALQAVTLGACFIEKHFTLDHDLPGPDHWFSSTPQEFADLAQAVRSAEERMGTSAIEPAASEAFGRQQFRLSIVAAQDLRAGTLLAADMLAFRRPGTGLLPKTLGRLLGATLTRDVARGEPLRAECFQGNWT